MVFMTPEWGGKDGMELPLIFHVPEANAIVSTGSHVREIKMPAPSKVIGIEDRSELVAYQPSDQRYSPWCEYEPSDWTRIMGGVDWLGGMNLTCNQY